MLTEWLGDAEDEAGGEVLDGGEEVKDGVVAARRVIVTKSGGRDACDVAGT